MGQQVNVYRKLKLFPGATVEGEWDGFDRGGDTYYVNNITGSDSADGKSWNSAVAQVEQAFVLSEASRVAGKIAATDYYNMNRIVVRGTGTAYTAVTTEPNYCEIVGFGSSTGSNGAGQVQIAPAAVAAVTIATTGSRGVNWYNTQFQGGGSGLASFDCTGSMLRCEFHGCSFYPITGSNAGIELNGGTYAGLVFKDCLIGCNHAGTIAVYGFYVTGQFSDCLVDHCDFATGSTAAFYTNAYLQNATVVRDGVFIGGTYGVHDASTNAGGPASNAIYVGNYCFGTTTGIILDQTQTSRTMDNVSNNNGTVLRITSMTS